MKIQNQNQTASAIPLIVRDPDTEKYKVNAEAVKFLSRVPKPISIISMVGLYRTGKSYLLNKMLLNLKSGGFQVGSTVNACTKGLWIWPEVIKGKTKDDKEVNILVIDTQGIGSLQQDSNHDVKIFVLGILLSSCFIYTSVGAIQSSSIDNLSLVIQLTQMIGKKLQSKLQKPQFLWILRDFSLALRDSDGNSLTSNQYLEKVLTQQKGSSQAIAARNSVRRCIRQFFPARSCICFVRPVSSTEKLNNLMSLPLEQLEPQFVQTMLTTKNRLFTQSSIKILGKEQVSGDTLRIMIQKYTEAVNSDTIPDILGAWDYINEQLQSSFLRQTLETLQNQFQEIQLPVNSQSLLKQLHRIKQKSTKKIQSFSLKTKNQFDQQFEKKQSFLLSKNNQSSREFILNNLNKKFRHLQGSINNISIEDFQIQMSSFQNQISKDQNLCSLSNYNEVFGEWKLKNYEEHWKDVCFAFQNKLSSQKELNKSMNELYQQQIEKLKSQMRQSQQKYSIQVLNLKNQKLKLECQLSIHEQKSKNCSYNTFQYESVSKETNELRKTIEQNKKQSVKEIQILRQELQFKSIKYDEMEQKYTEAKKSQMHYLSIIGDNPKQNKIVFDSTALKDINKEENMRLKERIDLLQGRIRTSQSQKTSCQIKISLFQQQLNRIRQEKEEIQILLKCKQKDFEAKLQVMDKVYEQEKQRCKVLEHQISDLKSQLQQKINFSTLQNKQQQHLQALKSFYQEQKRIKIKNFEQQKSKIQCKYQQKIYQIEKKIKQDEEQMEEIRNQLQQKLMQNQKLYKDFLILEKAYISSKDESKKKDQAISTLQKQKSQLEFSLKSLLFKKQQIQESLMRLEKSNIQKLQELKYQHEEKMAFQQRKLSQQKQSLKYRIQETESRFHYSQKNYLKQINQEQITATAIRDKYILFQSQAKKRQSALQTQLTDLKQSLRTSNYKLQESKKLFKNKIQQLQNKLEQLEAEKQNIQNNYENDKGLWVSKMEFLNQNKLTQKEHYMDKIRKLQEAIQFMGKNAQNQTYEKIVNQVNKKYQQFSEPNAAINIQEVNQRWQKQIKELRNDKQRLTLEYQKSINSQKQLHILKIKQMEERLKQSQNRRQILISQHQYERNNWNKERASITKIKKLVDKSNL